MVKLASTLSKLGPFKAMVIGDVMLDSYTIGKARRISPEAPVAIIHVQREERRPGGAGNVALNLLSLGAEIVVVGRVGNDWAGEALCEAFENEGISSTAIVRQEKYKTPVKNRIIADNQQVVRIDHEEVAPLTDHSLQEVISALPKLMQGVSVVTISDYGKGFLVPALLSAIIAEAKKHGCLIIADPKGHDFTKYAGVNVIKPNLGEAYGAAGMPPQASLDSVAAKLLQITQSDLLMVTRSEAGISLFKSCGDRQDFPAQIRSVKDVTGAGDTVLAMLAFGLANGLSQAEAAQLCNIAAGIAIEQVGCARVTLSDVAHRLLSFDDSNKVFDHDHLFALEQVLKQTPYILLSVEELREELRPLFRALRQLKEHSPKLNLLVYLPVGESDETMRALLTSLKEVDFILVDEESVETLRKKAPPQASYIFKDERLIAGIATYSNQN